jgi:hypothetical protein
MSTKNCQGCAATGEDDRVLCPLGGPRQAAELALKEARDKLAEAQSAREAAERALAEAKKGQ